MCRNMKFTSSQPSQAYYNPAIIYIYQREQINSSKFCSSNFLTCFIHQISSDFSTVKDLRYTVFAYRNLLQANNCNAV